MDEASLIKMSCSCVPACMPFVADKVLVTPVSLRLTDDYIPLHFAGSVTNTAASKGNW